MYQVDIIINSQSSRAIRCWEVLVDSRRASKDGVKCSTWLLDFNFFFFEFFHFFLSDDPDLYNKLLHSVGFPPFGWWIKSMIWSSRQLDSASIAQYRHHHNIKQPKKFHFRFLKKKKIKPPPSDLNWVHSRCLWSQWLRLSCCSKQRESRKHRWNSSNRKP